MIRIICLLFLSLLLTSCTSSTEEKSLTKPTFYIIDDTTVKNGRGDESGGLWGWGDPIVQYFDTTKKK